MRGFVQDLEGLALKNEDFRRVVFTTNHIQLVVMSLKPDEEIGAEVHQLDQIFRIEYGTGEVLLEGVRRAIRAGFTVIVPAGLNHNIINTGSVSLKLSTIYAPPNHRDGVIHHTREDAEIDDEHFDGKTTDYKFRLGARMDSRRSFRVKNRPEFSLIEKSASWELSK